MLCSPSISLVVEAVGIVDYPRVGERGRGLSKRCGNLGKGDGRVSRDFHIAAISIALVPWRCRGGGALWESWEGGLGGCPEISTS